MTRTRSMGGIVAIAVALASAAGAPARASTGGWDYLIAKLAADGVPRSRAEAVFGDPRVPAFDGLSFSLAPGESSSLYRGLLSGRSVRDARECLLAHRAALRRMEQDLGVAAPVVAAILHVESRCGRYTGNQVVLWRLARLAMAAEPRNLSRNVSRHALFLGPRAQLDVEGTARERASYLERTFYPEVRATFVVADRLGIDPLGIRGSMAGAFGLPQFLPTSYLRFGSDGNADGVVSLFDPDDAVASCGRYLQANGWKPGLAAADRRRVIWSYNRSAPYIDTVLALADRLPPP